MEMNKLDKNFEDYIKKQFPKKTPLKLSVKPKDLSKWEVYGYMSINIWVMENPSSVYYYVEKKEL